MKVSSVVFP
ncbi:unnamed protein product [Linum tenue]|uniref:Uncharacterized protein n=1 Tax=Linum tenue TaxID=586396 RepID=A0AAV0KU37_9ROSI|nr:unnamed protein product [Linum tenue]